MKSVAVTSTADSSQPLQVLRFRQHQQVLRPGIPQPIRLSAFKLADKPSPPLRGDDKVQLMSAPDTVQLLTKHLHAAGGPLQL